MPSYAHFPPHLQDVICPDRAPVMADEDLIGQTIRYPDSVAGDVRESTVHDTGTSKMSGNWYMIIDKDSDEEYMISEKEMKIFLPRAYCKVLYN